MPWNKTNWMSERVKFLAAYLEYEASITDPCHDFGVRRKTGDEWVRRAERDGLVALEERSRAPHTHPNAIATNVVQAIRATAAPPVASEPSTRSPSTPNETAGLPEGGPAVRLHGGGGGNRTRVRKVIRREPYRLIRPIL